MNRLVRSLFPRVAAPVARTARHDNTVRLHLNGLEDRAVPAVFTVTNINDTGAGSLRDAISQANAASDADTIVFDATAFASAQTITLATGTLTVSNPVVITGPGSSKLTVNNTLANNRVFLVDNASAIIDVTISGMKISGGQGTVQGGGIKTTNELLTLSDVIVTGNAGNTTGGGGIYQSSTGTLTISKSTISNNTTTGQGGGIYNRTTGTVIVNDSTVSGNTTSAQGGGLYFFSGGSLNVNNSTISGNTATSTSGGIYFFGTVGASGVVISNSTISGNTAGGTGGGIALFSLTGTVTIRNSTITLNKTGDATNGGGGIGRTATGGTLAIDSSVVAGNLNTASANVNPDGRSAGGTNTINRSFFGAGDSFSAALTAGTGNFFGTNAAPSLAKLGTLANNGGLTQTHLPQTGSPLLDVGSNPANLTFDQRGSARLSGTGVDIGSVELTAGTQLVSITSSASSPTNNSTVTFTITFNAAVTGLSATNLALTKTGLTVGTLGTPTTANGGLTWTVPVTGITGDGSLRLDMVNTTGTSPTPGGIPFTTGAVVVFDFTPPQITGFATPGANPTNAASVNYTVNFSEAVVGPTTGNFSTVATGTLAGTSVTAVTGSAATRTVTVNTGTGDGLLGLTAFSASGITDLAGNALVGVPQTSNDYTIDRTAPSVVTIATADPSPTNASTVNFTVTFNEPMAGVTKNNFTLATTGTVAGASITSVTPVAPGDVWVVTVAAGTGDGTLGLNLTAPATAKDVAGNALPAGSFTGQAYTIDRTAPVASSITRLSPNPTNGAASVQYLVTFNEPVQGVDTTAFDLTLGGGVTGNVASVTPGTGLSNTFTVTVDGISFVGTLQMNLAAPAAGTVVDAAGNVLTAAPFVDTAANAQYTITTPGAVNTIVPNGALLTNAGTVSWTVTFNQPVTGVSPSSFAVVAGGGVTGAAVGTVTPITTSQYTVTATTGTGDGTLALQLASNGTINPAMTNLPFTGGAFTLDRTPPVVASSALVNPPTNALSSVSWTVTFNEAVSGMTKGQFSVNAAGVTGASVTNVVGSGKTYTVTANTGTGSGTLGLIITGAGTTKDIAGNPYVPAAYTLPDYTLDRSQPTVASITLLDPSPTNAATVRWQVVTSEAVTGMAKSQFTLSAAGIGGAAIQSLTGSGTTYVVTATTGTGDGQLGLTLSTNGVAVDSAGNFLTGAPVAGPSYVIDRTAATVAGITKAGTSPTSAGAVDFTVQFNEAVSGLSPSNFVAVGGGGVTGASVTGVSGSGTTYTVTVASGTGDGTLALTLANAAGVTDIAGNGVVGFPTTGPAYVMDRTAPFATTFAPGGPTLTNAATVDYKLVFSEPVYNLTAASFTVNQVGVTGAAVSDVNGSGTTYLITVATGAGDGTLALVLNTSAGATDLAGNGIGSLPFTGPTFTLDRTRPSATVTLLDPALTNAATVRFGVTFGETITGLTAANFGTVVSGVSGAVVADVSGSGTSYTVTVNAGAGTGTLGLTLANPAGASDPAGNNPLPFTSPVYNLDRTPASATIAPAGALITNGPTTAFNVTFTKPVTGVSAANFGVSAVGVANTTVNSVTGSGTSYVVTVGTGTGTGTLALSFAGTGVTDVAGNTPLPATGSPVVIDRTGPVAKVATVAAQPLVSPLLPITVTFNEAVTGFAAASVQVVNGTVSNFVAQSKTVYTFDVAPVTTGDVTVTVGAGVATDVAGNLNTGTSTVTRTLPQVFPAVSLVPAKDPVNGPVSFTATFTQDVTGFTASDLLPQNAVVSDFAAVSPTVYTFTLTPTTVGAAGVRVPAGAAVNVFNTPNDPASASVTFDPNAPAATVVPALAGGKSSSATDPVVFLVTFNEPVTGFDATDVTVGGTAAGTASVSVTGSGTAYTVTVSGKTGPGTVTAAVTAAAASDAAGNGNTASNTATVSLPAPPKDPTPDFYSVGAGAGNPHVKVFDGANGGFRYDLFPFDPSAPGGIRTVTADMTGDGVPDVAIANGPGVTSLVQVFDGATGRLAFNTAPFEGSFFGGSFISYGDLTGDGVPDLVVSADQGGGPRVRVFRGGDFAPVADFFGIDDPNFRGGARTAVGDINRDGYADLVVAAGFGGGPRVAGYEGQSVLSSQPKRLFADFFAFEQSLRNGVYVASGDLNGDGFAEVIVGGGPGGGPRVLAFSGKSLLGNVYDTAANFYAGQESDRGGVRLAVKNLDGDNLADILVGSGEGAGSRVTTYLGKTIKPAGDPPVNTQFDAFDGFSGGVFVG